MAEPLNFFTPIGRFISGSLVERRSKDGDNRPIPENERRYEFGVAIEKEVAWKLLAEEFHPYLMSALSSDRNALDRVQRWYQSPGSKGIFSMKISDGDLPNAKGVVNQNSTGCFVFWFNALDMCTVDPNRIEINPDMVKCGYYVQVAGNIKSNNQPGDRAGIYLNGNIVRLMGEGDLITIGPDPDTAFGDSDPTNVPAGMRALGSSGPAAGTFGGNVAQAPTQPGSAAGVTAPPLGAQAGTAYPSSAPVQPHETITQGPPKLPGT